MSGYIPGADGPATVGTSGAVNDGGVIDGVIDGTVNILFVGKRATAAEAARSAARMGCTLVPLSGAGDACQLIAQHESNIKLMLIEVTEPDMDGLEALRSLRSLPESDFIPIISIVEGHRAAVESIRCGAADYIPKVELSTASFSDRLNAAIRETRSSAESAARQADGVHSGSEAPSPYADSAPDDPDIVGSMMRYVTYAKIAQALSRDYLCTYFVDTDDNTYIEYSSSEQYDRLGLPKSGYDFFAQSIENIKRVVFEEDRETLIAALDKSRLLQKLERDGGIRMIYRLILDDMPVYVCMRVTRLRDMNDPHIVIGIYNVHSEITKQRESMTYSGIARALAAEYFSIYYVNTETDEFIEFSSTDNHLDLGIEKSGSDFFELCRKNALRVIYPEDQELLIRSLDKAYILDQLDKNGTFKLTYRLLYCGEPTYVSLKATKMSDPGDSHIVIGVTNVQKEMEQRRESMTYSNIAAALAADYFSIYYVNTETDEFIEFSSNDNYLDLGIEKKGGDFFELCKKNALKVIYPEDQELLITAIDKSYILHELEKNGTFTLTYRLMYDGRPTYVSLKATRMKDPGDKHIVLGVASIDAQIKRERELSTAREIANRDALTGVKSKHAFVETQTEIDAQISKGTAIEFAVIVCDLNDLKVVNDTLGHNAGDKYIKNASEMICRTFQHSPVFRVGGDEFVVIISGSDYTMRDEQFAGLLQMSLQNLTSGGVVIACGMSEYVPGSDDSFERVFDRADKKMYENKKALKGGR